MKDCNFCKKAREIMKRKANEYLNFHVKLQKIFFSTPYGHKNFYEKHIADNLGRENNEKIVERKDIIDNFNKNLVEINKKTLIYNFTKNFKTKKKA